MALCFIKRYFFLIKLFDLSKSMMVWNGQKFLLYFQTYGPIFDIISALFEQLFDIKSDKEAFELKHLLIFITFLFRNLFLK